MSRSDELTVIERYFRPLAGEGAFDLSDDAARIVPEAGLDQVITSDMVASGVHFLPDDPPDTIARKALRVNLSDLASKGADPFGYSLNIALGPDVTDEWLAAFADGLAGDQKLYGIRLLGGDTISTTGATVVSVTAIGTVPSGRMVHRFRAVAGDYLYVSGAIGAAFAGLELLVDPESPFHGLDAEKAQNCMMRYRLPQPAVALTHAIRDYANAAMDVSDGLVGDADKLTAASGCTGTIIFDDIPLSEGLKEFADGPVAQRLITGGDDYEILASISPGNAEAFEKAGLSAGIPVSRIGWLAEGKGPVQVIKDGRELALGDRAYVHREQ